MKGMVTSGGSTRWFGRNLRASGLGVVSVWMKMLRVPRGADLGSVEECRLGRLVLEERLRDVELVCNLRAAE